MNKKTIFIILLASLLIFPFISRAQTLQSVVEAAANSLGALGIALSTIAFIVAGIMFLTAVGNPSRMTVAKGALIAGVVGILIIVLAKGACPFVNTFFGGFGSCS